MKYTAFVVSAHWRLESFAHPGTLALGFRP
jgi:hypothetical protein